MQQPVIGGATAKGALDIFLELARLDRAKDRKAKRRNMKCATPNAVIGKAAASLPGLKEKLCDESGKLRRFVNVYLNGEDIRFQDGPETVIKDGDEVSIIPAIAGG